MGDMGLELRGQCIVERVRCVVSRCREAGGLVGLMDGWGAGRLREEGLPGSQVGTRHWIVTSLTMAECTV